MAKNAKNRYMHTLDGRPAMWNGEYIHFENRFDISKLPTSLRELRRQQRIDATEGSLSNFKYGYILVKE